MKRYDVFIIVIYIALFIIVYLLDDVTFEMTTGGNLFKNGLITYLLSFSLLIYYSLKYRYLKKITSYATLLVVSGLFWISVSTTINKCKLLYYAAINEEAEATVDIVNLKQVFHKHNFDYTKIEILYKGEKIRLETSRTDFFALQNKKAIKVMIGNAGSDNYYITKVYWRPGEMSRARSEYRQFWIKRNWFVPVSIVLFVIGIFVSIRYGKSNNISSEQALKAKRKPAWVMVLMILGMVFAIVMIFYLLLLAYILIKFGNCNYCGL
jgi:hypothetical protein